MSLRIDTTDLIPGSLVIGNTGLGISGASIPTSGEDGGSILANDVESGDEAKEFRAFVVSVAGPNVATFFMSEDGSVQMSDLTDGTYTITYRLFVDGVDLGLASATFTVGEVQIVNVSVSASVQVNGSTTAVVTVTNQAQEVVYVTVASCTQAQASSSVAITLIVPTVPDEPTEGVDAGVKIRTWPFIKRDITRYRGDTYPEEFTFLNSENLEPLNLTGYSFTLTVSTSNAPVDDSTKVFQLVSTGPADGLVEMAPSESQADRVGYFYYDLQATDPQGRKRTVAYGRYVFKQDITK